MDHNFQNRNYQNNNDRFSNEDQSNNEKKIDLGTDDLLSELGKTVSSKHVSVVETDNKASEEKNNNKTSQSQIHSSNANIASIFEYLPNLIKEMHLAGIDFNINGLGEIIIKDFYRPSTMKMLMNSDKTFSIELRKENLTITTLDDLVDLNYREWRKTGKGKGNFSTASKCWTDLFSEKGLVRRQVVFIPVDE